MTPSDSDDPPEPMEPLWLDDSLTSDAVPVVIPTPVRCWRCARVEVPVAGRCPACGARLVDEVADASPRRTAITPRGGSEASHALTVVLIGFGLLLLTSVVWGWVLLANRGTMTEEDVTTGMATLEVFDTILVLMTLALVGRLALPDPPPSSRLLAWTLSTPALLLLIGLNLLYVAILREYIQPANLPAETQKITPLTVLLICLQPAIIEELFFRYLALGVLHRTTGWTAAVGVSAAMFSLAHLYNPLGMPYLFLVGIVLGYARVYGGLVLPMILHFFHNLAVLVIEVVK